MRGDRGRGTNSGSLVLLIDDQDAASHEPINEGDGENAVEEMGFYVPGVRWGAGKLGKTVRPILQHLQGLEPCTRADVARAMGRKSRDIRNPMNRLLEYGLVNCDAETNTYSLPLDLDDRLFEVLLANGTLETDFKHRKRYERERMAYRARLSVKETKRESVRGGKSMSGFVTHGSQPEDGNHR